jgi:hypothetical protein
VRSLALDIFGYLPEIERQKPRISQENRHLVYSTKFETLVQEFKMNDMDEEICQVLQFCKKNFSDEQ